MISTVKLNISWNCATQILSQIEQWMFQTFERFAFGFQKCWRINLKLMVLYLFWRKLTMQMLLFILNIYSSSKKNQQCCRWKLICLPQTLPSWFQYIQDHTTQHSSGQMQIIFPELFATYSQFLQAKMNAISSDRQRLCKLHKVGNTTRGKLPPWRKITQGF